MTEIKSFWVENKPTLEDIRQAFELVKTGIVVSIRWSVNYSGSYERLITKAITEEYTYEDYFKNCIPHRYGV